MLENKIILYSLIISSCFNIWDIGPVKSISQICRSTENRRKMYYYNELENIISIDCEYATFSDYSRSDTKINPF